MFLEHSNKIRAILSDKMLSTQEDFSFEEVRELLKSNNVEFPIDQNSWLELHKRIFE